MRNSAAFALAAAWVFGMGCQPTATAQPSARNPSGTATTANASSASTPSGPSAKTETVDWQPFTSETMARAKRENRFLLLDGAAEWCHWCHVMDDVTYRDPRIVGILREKFIAIKVDIDSNPDVQERYNEWGWPATILFSPSASELGKYKGYIEPDELFEILNTIVATGKPTEALAPVVGDVKLSAPLSSDLIAFISAFTEADLEEYYDEKEGGWGRTQKAPIGWTNAWALERGGRGDARAKERALFALKAEEQIIDPVWGGMYQYSTDSDWRHPHYEKLGAVQALAIDNYARAFLLTKDPKWLGPAQKLRGYVDRFLTSSEGGFYTTQDADLNAHERAKGFLAGHAYYALNEQARLAKGLPRIDTNEYADNNGLMIAGYASLYEATRDAAILQKAERSARRILSTHASAIGLSHGPTPKELRTTYLADQANFAWGLLRLYDVTNNAEHLTHARTIADTMVRKMGDPRGGFFAHSEDPNAVGAFAERRKPFETNVMAARVLLKLDRLGKNASHKDAIERTFAAIATPAQIKARGRMIGDFLLALEELRASRAP